MNFPQVAAALVRQGAPRDIEQGQRDEPPCRPLTEAGPQYPPPQIQWGQQAPPLPPYQVQPHQYPPPCQSYPPPQYPPQQYPATTFYPPPQQQPGNQSTPPVYEPFHPPAATQQQPGAWGSGVGAAGPMDFGIPEDKLVTEDLDISIRHGFVRKVYAILTVQLTITFAMALFFNLHAAAGLWLRQRFWVMLIAFAVAIVLILVLTCIPSVARSHPTNLILLFLLSVTFGFILGYSCAAVSTPAFAIAAGITAAVSLGLSIFACQTKWDFTGCGAFVFVTLIVLLVFGIVAIFIRNRIVQLVYAALGALLFSFYMVYDTQQIVGGKHRKFQYSIDDYVFASLTLYMDIINLFMYILQLVTMAAGEQ